jgi:phosphopantetheine adenylyltransferase
MSFSEFVDSKLKSFKNTLNSFKLDLNEDFSKLEILKTEDFITESVSGDRLDISILAANKFLNSSKKLEWFFNTPVEIEAKTDGVKVTALKIADDGDLSDWIIAYKGHILYSEEFNYNSDDNIKKSSIGSSQFKIVLDHFKSLGKTSIPVGTELQLEYLMRKPTLSSNYERPHGIVLIGYSKSTYTAEFGILKTKNSGMKTAKRDIFAKELKLNVPLKIFNGVMSSKEEFERGILAKDLKIAFSKFKEFFDFSDYTDTYNRLSSLLLGIPSVFGGKEEGVVLKFSDGKILKIQQDYQLDQVKRAEIKNKWKESDESSENQYWENVKGSAYDIFYKIDKKKSLSDMLSQMSSLLKRYELNYSHSKKNETIIKDDIELNVKTLILKSLKGNNGCLVLGKFRVLTKAHFNLIKLATKEFDKVLVCLVSSKDTAKTEDLRLRMLEVALKQFGNKVQIVKSSNGNLLRIISNSDFNINAVYAGSDRVSDYEKQLKNVLGMKVKELVRTDEDISATKVIANINNEKYFKQNTPKEIHFLYSDILKEYS